MKLTFLPLWSFVGAPLFNKRGVIGVVRALCGKGKERKKVWLSAPLCLFWIVWKERNSRAFENEEQSIHGCKSFFLCNLWAWTRGFFGSGPPSIVDFVDWLGAG